MASTLRPHVLIDDQVADDECTSRADDKAYSDDLLIRLVRTVCSVVHQALDDHDVPMQDGESPFDSMDEEVQAQIVCPLCSKYFKMTNRMPPPAHINHSHIQGPVPSQGFHHISQPSYLYPRSLPLDLPLLFSGLRLSKMIWKRP